MRHRSDIAKVLRYPDNPTGYFITWMQPASVARGSPATLDSEGWLVG